MLSLDKYLLQKKKVRQLPKIRPLPKAPPRKTNTNSRRKRKSTVLTDTPEKDILQKEYEEKIKKKQKKDDKIKGKVKERGRGREKPKINQQKINWCRQS